MFCIQCRSLPAALQRHPRGPLGPAAAPALRTLVCERCGAPAGHGIRPRALPDVAALLERAGLRTPRPLLCRPPRAA